MIAHVRGTVTSVSLGTAVIDVGGIGLELQCAPSTLATLRTGTTTTLSSTLIVREDSMTLFGFSNDEEKTTFLLVQSASGVGPKLAQAIVAVLPPETLRTAIAGGDVKTLTKVPGIGPKVAQRIILELKDKIGAISTVGTLFAPTGPAPWRSQVSEALVQLGYSEKDATRAVEALPDPSGDANVSLQLKAALKILSKV